MRKIIVTTNVTLDTVIQAPMGSEEDISGDFKYGGWTAANADAITGKSVQREMSKPQIIFWAEKHLRFLRPFGPCTQTCGPVSMMVLNTSCPKRLKTRIGKTLYSSKVWKISNSSKFQKGPIFRFGAVASLSTFFSKIVWWTSYISEFSR